MRRIVSSLALAAAAITVTAQTPAVAPPPTTGILVSYQYWPSQYVQWLGPETPYAMFELDVDTTGKQPVLYVSLTDRATGKRIHYTNSDALMGMGKALGEETHKTEIAFEGGDTTNVGSTCSVRLSMADGKPLQWRFVQGSDISEQGSGLTALPDAKIPIFAYREQGAVAGEGTALQIGDVVSTAEMWKEISHPPYFIAYRGALTSSAHMIVFTPGKEVWTIAAAPKSITAGNTWELDSATGNHRSLKIDKVEGTHLTITGSDRFTPSTHFTLEATLEGTAWTINSVRYAPIKDGAKHYATLTLPSLVAATDKPGAMTLTINKAKPIATGTVAATADHSLTLDFTTPTWAHGKLMTEATTATPTTLTIMAQPTKP